MPRMKALPPPPPLRRGPRALTDRPTRMAFVARRMKRLLRPAAWGMVGLALVVLVFAAARQAGSGGMFDRARQAVAHEVGFQVRNVVIEGRTSTPESLLRAALGVSPGDSLLGFSVAAARARIETLTWVQNASVERRMPDTLVVKLTEKRPFAVWQNQKHFSLIDRQGQVVGDQDVARFRDLPLVVGADAPAHAADMLDLLAKFPELQSHVEALVRVGERRWNLHLASGADVMLPEGNENAALARLAELQASSAVLDRPIALVDMRLPDRLVIRPRTTEAPHEATPGKPDVKKPT